MSKYFTAISSNVESMSLTSGSSTFELGNELMILKENLEAVSIRVYPPNTQEIKGTIWSSDGTKLGETETYTCKAREWTMLPLKEAVTLESGKSYVVSGSFIGYYKFQDHTSNSPDECSIIQGRFSGNIGSFPIETSANDLYGIVDLVMKEVTTSKYLINSENVYYTTKNGVLEQIEITELNASSFVAHGSDVIPTWENIQSLINPEILCWNDTVEVKPILKANMTAVPVEQTLITDKIDLTHSSIHGIEKVTVTCENELIVAVSFDEKQTWKVFNNNQWVTVSNEYAGMSKDAIESITIDQWNELYLGATSFYIRVIFENTQQTLTSINVDFVN